jgi:hypothetical protein
MVFTRKAVDNSNLIVLLDQLLKLEYSFVIVCPRSARLIKDNDTRILVGSVGMASVRHADIVAAASTKFGGNPIWQSEDALDGPDLIEMFRGQLDKAKEAFQLHQQCLRLIRDENFEFEFSNMAEEEQTKIKTLQKVITNLERGAEHQDLMRPFLTRVNTR